MFPLPRSLPALHDANSDFCALCQRQVKDPRHFVRVGHFGAAIVRNEDADRDPAGDLGFLPLHDECVNQFPNVRPYLIDEDIAHVLRGA